MVVGALGVVAPSLFGIDVGSPVGGRDVDGAPVACCADVDAPRSVIAVSPPRSMALPAVGDEVDGLD